MQPRLAVYLLERDRAFCHICEQVRWQRLNGRFAKKEAQDSRTSPFCLAALAALVAATMRGKREESESRKATMLEKSDDIKQILYPAKVRTVISHLVEAYAYARDTNSNRWDFAVSIRSLTKNGVNEEDLRWLVRKGLVEHAREVTLMGDNGRSFRPTGDLTFSTRTCFVLTEKGIAESFEILENSFASSSLAVRDQGERERTDAARGYDQRVQKPHWDPETRKLLVGEKIVKRFKWQAINQETVLNAFQEEGWPERIDDPLPPHPEQDSKRRLTDTIKCLNRKQMHPLIHFRGDGTGEGIIWEPKSQREPASREEESDSLSE